MSKEKGNHIFLKRVNILLVLIVALIVVVLPFYPKYQKMNKLKSSEENLDKEIERKEKEIIELKERQKEN